MSKPIHSKIVIGELYGQDSEKVLRVANFIEFMTMFNPSGLRILLGEIEPPSDADYVHMWEEWRRKIKKELPLEYFTGAVDMAGGWKHIQECVRRFRAENSLIFAAFLRHVQFCSDSVSRYGSLLGYIAVKLGISPRTVSNYRRATPEYIAALILASQKHSEIAFRVVERTTPQKNLTWPEVKEKMRLKANKLSLIEDYLEMILYSHDKALSILLGDVTLEDSEIPAMFERVRAYMPDLNMPLDMAEKDFSLWCVRAFKNFVSIAGGWPVISAAVKQYKESNPKKWNVVSEFRRLRVCENSNHYTARLGYLTAAFSLSPDSIIRYRFEFPSVLAAMIIASD